MDGMKSNVVDAPSVRVGDHFWRKIILDFQELVYALERDALSELITDVLRSDYGEWKMFSFLVYEMKRVVMRSVATSLEGGVPNKNSLSIVFRHDLYEKLEMGMKNIHEPSKYPPNASYWVGENPSAS